MSRREGKWENVERGREELQRRNKNRLVLRVITCK